MLVNQEGEFYVLDQELFVVLYYSYSYFIIGSCYLCYIIFLYIFEKCILLLKFTANCSYMQSHEVTPYLLNYVLMISSKLTWCSLCQYE